jgi:hypothetical protein
LRNARQALSLQKAARLRGILFVANKCSPPGRLPCKALHPGSAGLGADLHNFMPQVPVGTMALLAMVAYFAGVVQARLLPLSSSPR